MMKTEILAMILAGGQGTRLGKFTKNIAKPAVPFGAPLVVSPSFSPMPAPQKKNGSEELLMQSIRTFPISKIMIQILF